MHGYLQNLLRGHKDLGDWDILSASQKDGLQNAINDLDAGNGIVHEEVNFFAL